MVYGGPIQEALIERIDSAVKGFKLDLPDIVRELEIIRFTKYRITQNRWWKERN